MRDEERSDDACTRMLEAGKISRCEIQEKERPRRMTTVLRFASAMGF